MNTQKLRASFADFFLRPAYASPLAALRIGLALVLLLQAFLLRHSLVDLYGSDGLLQGDLAQFFINPKAPQLRWIVDSLALLHVEEARSLLLAGGAYVVSLVFLLLGFHSRVAAFFAWLLHCMFLVTGETTYYGVDLYAHVFLFYLIFAPSGDALSLDLLLGRTQNLPTWNARLILRVMQLEMCISYLMSAKDKAQGIQWWTGEVMWRVFSVPLYARHDMSWTAHWPHFLQLLAVGSLVLEAGYCIFIWPQRTRKLWIAGILALHLGIIVFIGLLLFGLIMCVLTAALFGVSPEKPLLVPESVRAFAVRLLRPAVPATAMKASSRQ